MRRTASIVLGLAMAWPVGAEPVGNGGIVKLHQAGLSAEAIVAKIRQGQCDYDTSTAGLIALGRAGVPQAAIVAAIDRCGDGAGPVDAGQGAGIFLQRGNGGQRMLRPSAVSSVRVVGPPPGLGGLLFPTVARLVLPQSGAQVVSPGGRPVFMFRFVPSKSGKSDFGELWTERAQSPSEFSLVRFRVDGGSRQVTIGRVHANVENAGIDPKNTLPFAVTDQGGGAFRVEMTQDLPPGEYGFVLIGEREKRRGVVYRIYDFAVGTPQSGVMRAGQ